MAELHPNLARYIPRYVQIESGGDPNARSGKYTGLLQMGPDEIAKYGGNSLEHGRALLADRAANFERTHGRQPTGTELYLLHQQGEAGLAAHMKNPTGAAWQNVRQYYPSEAVARQAIWGNVPTDQRAQFGDNVNNVSSQQFMDMWNRKVERLPPQEQQPPVEYAGTGEAWPRAAAYTAPAAPPVAGPTAPADTSPLAQAQDALAQYLPFQRSGPRVANDTAPTPVSIARPPPAPDIMQSLGPRPIDVSALQQIAQAPQFGASSFGRQLFPAHFGGQRR